MSTTPSKNKKVIIILGPPGSGKGTQAELLAEKLNFYHFETSKILEESFKQKDGKKFIKVDGQKFYFSQEQKLWKTGILNSPPFVIYLTKNKVKELFNLGKNLLFSASPRTFYEAVRLAPLLIKLYGLKNIKVILLEQREEFSILRNSRRRICELMRHPILYSKETVKLKFCPLDGSKLVKRGNLDAPETIKVRLKEYEKKTIPVVESLKKQGLPVKEINAEKTVAEVFNDILKLCD